MYSLHYPLDFTSQTHCHYYLQASKAQSLDQPPKFLSSASGTTHWCKSQRLYSLITLSLPNAM